MEQTATETAPVEEIEKKPLGDIIIETKNLSKVYRAPFSRETKQALTDLNINVRRGEIFGLVGPNGSGTSDTPRSLGNPCFARHFEP